MQKTHRIIYELHFLLWNNQHVQVTLDRTGNATGDANDGRPHPPKLRTIDLRPGDKVMFGQSWYLIRGIVCTRDEWLTEEQAANLGGDDGYISAEEAAISLRGRRGRFTPKSNATNPTMQPTIIAIANAT